MFAKLKKLAARARHRARTLVLRTRQRLSLYNIPAIPNPPAWQFPVGMHVSAIGNTGVRVIDGFCSPDEAERMISIGRETVKRSTVIGPDGKSIEHDYRTSSDILIKLTDADPTLLGIVHRAAALLGLPMSHAETFSLTRYGAHEYYKSHLDHDGSLRADRLYTVLLYLNDLAADEGGGTCFEKLNFVTQPVRGRALLWLNSDKRKNALPDTVHASLPVLSDNVEKWVAQIWFRSYPVSSGVVPTTRAEPASGEALTADIILPDGIVLHQAN